jgi:hypothetical protein
LWKNFFENVISMPRKVQKTLFCEVIKLKVLMTKVLKCWKKDKKVHLPWKGWRTSWHIAHTISSVAFINPTFLEPFENWHSQSFSQTKNTLFFYFSQKVSHEQFTGLPTFWIFTILHHTLFDWVFIVKVIVWVRCKGILMRKIQISKTQQFKKKMVSITWKGIAQNSPLKKI